MHRIVLIFGLFVVMAGSSGAFGQDKGGSIYDLKVDYNGDPVIVDALEVLRSGAGADILPAKTSLVFIDFWRQLFELQGVKADLCGNGYEKSSACLAVINNAREGIVANHLRQVSEVILDCMAGYPNKGIYMPATTDLFNDRSCSRSSTTRPIYPKLKTKGP